MVLNTSLQDLHIQPGAGRTRPDSRGERYFEGTVLWEVFRPCHLQ